MRWCDLKKIAARSGNVRNPSVSEGAKHMRYRTSQRSAGIFLALLLILALAGSCKRRPPKSQIDPNAYAKEIEQWHQERWKELNGESGWLTLVGLFWLKDGINKCGSDPTQDITLPKEKIPPQLAEFLLEKDKVFFGPVDREIKIDGQPVSTVMEVLAINRPLGPLREPPPPSLMKYEPRLELKPDADSKPTILTFRSLTFQIIKRGDKLGLRVKDSQNPDRLNFKGTEFYPTDVNWRIDARFEPYNPPKPMPITNVLGMESAEASPGAVKFEVGGQEYRLDAVTEKNEPRLFMIMADKTSGKETYPAGRYLYVDPPDASGRVVIDFNKAFSPPCAFTRFATCPLPPRQNRLPIAIVAGEKYTPHSAPATP